MTQLERQLNEERTARKRLEVELNEIKRMLTTLTNNLNGRL